MEEIHLIVQYDTQSLISEAYRAIRTNLQFALAGETMRRIGFTSATPGEGKSVTTSNMALSTAQDGKRVLLMDCDMRRPMQHKIFELQGRGLSDCIAMNASFEEVVCREVFPNLDILVSGPVPPNPSELLGSAGMKTILKHVEIAYDYVFIDMPPILAVTDASVLASQVEGIILVVKSGIVSPKEVKTAKRILQQGGANLLGVILNAVPNRQYGGYGYYYYYDEEHHAQHTKREK